jgi:hypothetical protein
MGGRCASLGHGEAALVSWPLSHGNAADSWVMPRPPRVLPLRKILWEARAQHGCRPDRNVGSWAREGRCSMTRPGQFGERTGG